MKTLLRILLALALAGAGYWLWSRAFPSPQTIVRNKMSELAAVASVGAEDNNIVRAGKVSKLSGMFAADIQIIINVPGGHRSLSSREELRETMIGIFAGLQTLQIAFLDISITVSPDKQTAEVSCVARGKAGDGKELDVQEMKFQFCRIDGSWLIRRVETINTLQ